ncbi:MAG: glycogen debranching protein [Cyclobacteriaceae bacterium]|nr:MAG: glycogen debranching protein [Cyclobacteriaceae bacterium]
MKPTLTAFVLLLFSCSPPEPQRYGVLMSSQSAIAGKLQYLQSPFVTAGDRVYMVGHQDGSFPDLGWHVTGEMGGIWNHPIKLMDGFVASLTAKRSGNLYCLNNADRFINYPVGNQHHFIWSDEGIDVQRFQFAPDGWEGMVVEYTLANSSAVTKQFDFSFTGMVDLRPTWLGERTNMIDAEDEVSFDKELSAVVAKDKNNPWYVVFGSALKTSTFSSTAVCGSERKGLGANGTLTYELTLQPGATQVIQFFIAGSYQSESAARETFSFLKNMGPNELVQKLDRYKKIKATANLTIPDKELTQMYEWLKYNTEWLVRTVPEQGSAVSAGLPDYPWWFGADMTYTMQGILATGNHTLAKNSIELLSMISKQTNGNGRIIHEVSTNGAVFNPGNVNETAQYITMLKLYADWTGDKELITQLFPDVQKGIAWLTETMDEDQNGYPNGNGMMEIHGLDTEMIDVVAYTQQALASAAYLAEWVGEKQLAIDYQRKAEILKTKINAEWWNEQEQSFGDFRSTVAEAKPIVAAALVRADTLGKPWAVKELKATEQKMKTYATGKQFPFVVYHNWVVNTPMETGVADKSKALAALQTATKYENPFGVYVTGIDRSDEPDSVVLKSRKKTFSYTGAVMTLPTGVQAVAAANYDRPNEALGYIKKLQQSFSYALPGSMYEVSPDFGMVVQAWNIYGVAVPVIHSFLGIEPHALEQQINISPQLPDAWNEAAIENVKIGTNTLSIKINRNAGYDEYHVQQTDPAWRLVIHTKGAKQVLVNQKETTATDQLSLQGAEHVVRIYW